MDLSWHAPTERTNLQIVTIHLLVDLYSSSAPNHSRWLTAFQQSLGSYIHSVALVVPSSRLVNHLEVSNRAGKLPPQTISRSQIVHKRNFCIVLTVQIGPSFGTTYSQ